MPKTILIGIDPGGFCAYWSTWYLDLRLSNPDVPRETLVSETLKSINNKIADYNYDIIMKINRKKIPVNFSSFVRSYAVFLNVLWQFILNLIKDYKNNKLDINEDIIMNDAFEYIINL